MAVPGHASSKAKEDGREEPDGSKAETTKADRQTYNNQPVEISGREVFGAAEPEALMKIAENIEALELPMNLMGQSSVIYPALLWDSSGATLVDTGIPAQLDTLIGEIENAGVDFKSVQRIILTHQDIDHIGGLPEIVRIAGTRSRS